MEPSSEVKKVTVEDARAKGMERINKLLNFIAPVFAPGMLAEAGVNAVKEKWEKSETKKHWDAFVEKAEDTADDLSRRWNRTRKRVGKGAVELGKRAAVLGLKPVVGGETAWKWATTELPALVGDLREGANNKKVERLTAALNKAKERSQKARESAKSNRERGKKMNAVRKLAESLQTKG